MTQVTLNKGGTGEQIVDSASIQIPDLWHIAVALGKNGDLTQSDDVLECWHLTHSLLRYIQDGDS